MTQAQIVQIDLLLENKDADNTIFLRSLYRTKQYKKASEHLSAKLTQFQTEIKNTCFTNYKDFLSSVDVLFSVKKQILTLKQSLNTTNENIQMSGAKLVAIRLERDQTQKTLNNLESCVCELESCLNLLQMANKFNASFKEGDFYIALKILERLQKIELPRKEKYEFVQYFQICIPEMKDMIKNRVIMNKREWLYNLKPQMQKLIRREIEQVYFKKIKTWNSRKTQNYGINWTFDEKDTIKEKSTVIETDLKPILQCLYIHKKMDLSLELIKSFQEDRKAQFNLLTVQKLNLSNTEDFKSLFYDFIGFFVVEKQIIFQAPELRSSIETSHLFSILVDKIVNEVYLQVEKSNYENISELSNLNNLLIAATMMFKKLSYHVHKLDDLTNAITSLVNATAP